MSQQPLIKICGVMDEATARQVAALGADWVGIVCSDQSQRKVTAKTLPAIASACREAGAEPVAVVTHHNANQIQALCQQAAIRYVQLHSRFTVAQGRQLPTCIKRIPVCQIAPLMTKLPVTAMAREPDEAYVLIDGPHPGRGQGQHLTDLSVLPANRRYIIAGGLTPDNVSAFVTKLNPYGVDVATGVERAPGIKDLSKVNDLIQATKNGV